MFVADLISRSAAHGLLPIGIGSVTLSELEGPITSVAPFRGKAKAVKETLGGWPAPNRSKGAVVWSGRNEAFVLGNCPDLTGLAATTDQTDAWAHLLLEGADMAQVLARLCPLDLNPSVMKNGHAARSLLGHMNALYWRRGKAKMEIFVFRSMARTAIHELERAMTGIAARAEL